MEEDARGLRGGLLNGALHNVHVLDVHVRRAGAQRLDRRNRVPGSAAPGLAWRGQYGGMGLANRMRTTRRGQLVGVGLATLWLVVFVVLDVNTPPTTTIFITLFPVAALIACAVLSPVVTAAFAAAAVIASASGGWWDQLWRTDAGEQAVRVVDAALIGGAAVVIAAVRVRRERQLARMTTVAEVAQRSILPKMPPIVGTLAVAARYVSAADDILVGGDLYDYCADDAAARLVIGDVRGKGLDAVEQAARVIRAFRQFAASEADLSAVAKSIGAYLRPFLDDEEFITALLVDASAPGFVTLLSCGHPPPLLIHGDGEVSVPELPAGLPLGLGDGYTAIRVPWQPGDRLLMFTDGLSEARDAHGEFFSPLTVASRLAREDLDAALDTMLHAVRRHVAGGRLADDLAVMLVQNLAPGDVPDPGRPAAEVHGLRPGAQGLGRYRVTPSQLGQAAAQRARRSHRTGSPWGDGPLPCDADQAGFCGRSVDFPER